MMCSRKKYDDFLDSNGKINYTRSVCFNSYDTKPEFLMIVNSNFFIETITYFWEIFQNVGTKQTTIELSMNNASRKFQRKVEKGKKSLRTTAYSKPFVCICHFLLQFSA